MQARLCSVVVATATLNVRLTTHQLCSCFLFRQSFARIEIARENINTAYRIVFVGVDVCFACGFFSFILHRHPSASQPARAIVLSKHVFVRAFLLDIYDYIQLESTGMCSMCVCIAHSTKFLSKAL